MTNIELRRHKARLQRQRRQRLERAGHKRIDITIPRHVWERLYPMFSEHSQSYPGAAVVELLERLTEGRLPSNGGWT